jgi:hypothetical protein
MEVNAPYAEYLRTLSLFVILHASNMFCLGPEVETWISEKGNFALM